MNGEGPRPLIKQGVKNYDWIRRLVVFTGFSIGLLITSQLFHLLSQSFLTGNYTGQLGALFYFALAAAFWGGLLLVINLTQDYLIVIVCNLGSVLLFWAFNFKSFSGPALLGFLGFLLLLTFGSISLKSNQEETLKLNLNKLNSNQWKFITWGLICLIIFNAFLTNFSYKSFPLSEQTFKTLTGPSEPIIKGFLPNFSFNQPISQALSEFVSQSSQQSLANLSPELVSRATNSAVNQQIQNLNKAYGLNLTGQESVNKVVYEIAEAFWQSKDETVRLGLFVVYLIIIILILQFIFWVIGLAYRIFSTIILYLARFWLIKITTVQAPKEILTLE